MKTDEIRGHIEKSQFLVVYFSKPDCSVCISLLPKVRELVGNFPEVGFLYLNLLEHSVLAGEHLILAVPSIVVFQSGKELRRFVRTLFIDDLNRLLLLAVPRE